MFEELADLMEVKKAEILAEVMHNQNKSYQNMAKHEDIQMV